MLGRWNPIERLGRAIRGAVKPLPVPAPAGSRVCRVIGHRGAARVAPENTLDSFRCALDLGADAIETDVCVTRDGRFLLWHDADPSETVALARASGRELLAFTPDVPTLVSPHRRPVRDLDYGEFSAHYGYRRRRGGLEDLLGDDGPPEVPAATLHDLFGWIAGERRLSTVCLDVKLSARQTDEARFLWRDVAVFAASLREGGLPVPEIRFLTPDENVLAALREEAARVPHDHRLLLHADFELTGALDVARRLGIRNVSMGLGRRLWPGFRDEAFELVRARDLGELDSVILWTVSEPDRLRDLVAAGVDGILTDDPPLLAMIVREAKIAACSTASTTSASPTGPRRS
jgi:glycerophosphoryl diester phosphodiesterase